MEVYVNGQRVILFKGAKVKHALLKADESLYHLARAGKVVIRDQEGNLVDWNGRADEGFHYDVKPR
ncbi:hypothetical protein CathTA2_1418 [Caldalkalibacillus thermarum TA2.A1]|uniref:Uncharacterized protein n=1 Tax=Caldalkalibacillus thermarum (strain TA2.A1) TaxID=986075 RepID=F5L6G8_CALTT|nr:hypothetical protein [Caldalkalibacillus thermarum]EGL83078.1 hypothetical protein CathTA2_1418 [Caldalkalibacillus thermarum TA2.A1]QZT34913.1 hypothetical protein HUR95_06605 [Caldalkalibacillus thermarum TA2.A1]